MSTNDTRGQERDPTDRGTDVDGRTRRAVTECMTVLEEGGAIYTVVGQHGNGAHRVDAREGRCTCPDAEYRLTPDQECKHQRRVAVATGARAIPAGVDRSAVDPQLGAHVDGTVRFAATDGGVNTDPNSAGDEAELGLNTDRDDAGDALDDSDDEPECWCDELGGEAPCWPCFRDGRATFPDTVADRDDDTEAV